MLTMGEEGSLQPWKASCQAGEGRRYTTEVAPVLDGGASLRIAIPDEARPASIPRLSRMLEREMRKSLNDWRAMVLSDVSQARQAFRQLLNGPILLTPVVAGGYRAVRHVRRIGLESVFQRFNAV